NEYESRAASSRGGHENAKRTAGGEWSKEFQAPHRNTQSTAFTCSASDMRCSGHAKFRAPLRNNLLNRVPVVDIQPLPTRHLKPSRIQAHQLHHRRVNIRHIMGI